MAYTGVPLSPLIEIPEIITIHYFEYSSDFSFAGEAHDFWEFLCVDKGEVEAEADGVRYPLTRGDLLFHQPDEFHRLTANHRVAPNLVVVSFRCDSAAMDFFRKRLLTIDDGERQLLGRIIAEARNAFLEPLDNPYQTHMKLKEDAPEGALQMIRLHLELLLLTLLRRCQKSPASSAKRDTIRRKKDDEAYHQVIAYLNGHLCDSLTLDQIAQDTLMGKSRLQQLIHTRHDCGVIDLFSHLKMDYARQLIRENRLNFTEVAEALGYSSVHYFSRLFKKQTGMSPSEYSSSIKGIAENPCGR